MYFYILILFTLLSCSDSTKQEQQQTQTSNNPEQTQAPLPPITPRRISPNARSYVYFTPRESDVAFNEMFYAIRNAKEEVKVTVYSWSLKEFSDALIAALKNNVKVKVAIKKSLATGTSYPKSAIEQIEALGGEVKTASVELHEKFIIIDDQLVINGSANMSHGPTKSYSENLVFHFEEFDIIEQFNREFELVWNSAEDYISENDPGISSQLPQNPRLQAYNTNRDVQLITSTLNFNFAATKLEEAQKGQYLLASLDESKWSQRDAIIAEINQAKKSVVLIINHFNISEIADALLAAIKRGVDVKISASNVEVNQSSPLCSNCSERDRYKEKIHYFITEYKKITGNAMAPVRFKYYSHQPSHIYWRLNHHKVVLIDYEYDDQANNSSPVLITGSYNFSKTAEQDKFDNLVIYKSERFKTLYARFYEEFEHLYYQNRNDEDRPRSANIDYFARPENGYFPIHNINDSVSLNMTEILRLRQLINDRSRKINPYLRRDMFSRLNYTYQKCFFFDPASERFLTSKKTPCYQ